MDVKMNPGKDEHIDPVCGMTVTGDGRYQSEHAGEKYYFCSEHCLNKFREHPERYLQGESTPDRDSHAAPGGCTCPMHPEVRQDHPGNCPKCGMALEAAGVPATLSKTEYTCPMHPEVRQDHPGNCPKCGMALEAVTVDVEEKMKSSRT
jgi:Uncharacterized conserved protein